MRNENENENEKNIIVSKAPPTIEENNGACHQEKSLSFVNINISNNWANRKADPDAKAILVVTAGT